MRFDLTKNVILEPNWRKRYLFARCTLCLAFVAGCVYFAYVLLFPTRIYFIDFANPKNINRNNNFFYDGRSQEADIYSAYSREDYSSATFRIFLDKNSPALKDGEISVRKTYQSFAYPVSRDPAGFPDGSLVKNDGQQYIVSDGRLRKFANAQIARALGFRNESFRDVLADELNYNAKGADITDAKNYPDNSLFAINGTYYQLKNQQFYPFVSQKAFLSFFELSQAVEKDGTFLDRYPVSSEALGFADGTLLSFDISVFIVVQGKIMPFNNPLTFLSFGYQWKDVIPATGDEIGLYQRDKLFTIDRPHPDGTIFKTTEAGKYFLVKNGERRPLVGNNILMAYLREKSPVSASEQSLKFSKACRLGKNFWPLHSYQCTLTVAPLDRFPGNQYQLSANNISRSAVSYVNAIFFRSINWNNMRDSLAIIKNKILVNYGYATPF